jgi:predicted Rossmann fold flavoprotein
MFNNQEKSKIWDVAVIGGGPAGMMSAGRSAELGASVILIEKNEKLGKKLLITGGGRCNMTNNELDIRKFLEKFKDSSKFLFSTFSQWSVKETLDFFHNRGLETKLEENGRVFPADDKAASVFAVLTKYLEQGGVTVKTGNPVVEIIKNKENKIESVRLANGDMIYAKSFILATGGKSRPETGSTGDGFLWLKNLGHKVIPPNPSLVPIAIKDSWVKALSGVVLPMVKITVLQNNKKQVSKKGRILFTHFGLSGPTILNMSKDIGESLKYGDVSISLDLFPASGYDNLNNKLQDLFKVQSNKKIKNAFDEMVQLKSIHEIIFKLAKIDPETFCHSVTREERLALVKILKDIPMQVSGLLGVDKAIVTSGGVSLEEVDWKTMRSRLFDNLYFVGDILDIDRPSGGYSLQLCWTTGRVAGDWVSKPDK